MRFDGTLTQWSDDRGFGFITPTQGGQDVFVHISSFARDGRHPQLKERLSFEVELNKDGKKRAMSVRRPEVSRPNARRSAPAQRSRPARSLFAQVVTVVMLVALGVYGYAQYAKRTNAYAAADSGAAQVLPAEQWQPPALTQYRCDGRQHCAQMTSCAEATFFLKNCPGVKMDGNNDGVPCEQQWCTSSFAN